MNIINKCSCGFVQQIKVNILINLKYFYHHCKYPIQPLAPNLSTQSRLHAHFLEFIFLSNRIQIELASLVNKERVFFFIFLVRISAESKSHTFTIFQYNLSIPLVQYMTFSKMLTFLNSLHLHKSLLLLLLRL